MKLIDTFRRDRTVRREASIVLTDLEDVWWSAHSGTARWRTLVIAVTGTSMGMCISLGLIGLLERALEVTILKHDLSVGMGVFQAVLFASVGWWALLRTERDKAIRSRRLRLALEMEDERVVPAATRTAQGPR